MDGNRNPEPNVSANNEHVSYLVEHAPTRHESHLYAPIGDDYTAAMQEDEVICIDFL
jgi:hypothetical protein